VIAKIVTAWPAIRKGIYMLLVAGLSMAFTYGKVDAAQQASILESATQLLAIIGFGIAIFYTPKGGKVIGDGTDVPVVYNVTDMDEAMAKVKARQMEYHVSTPIPNTNDGPSLTLPPITVPLPTVEQMTEAVDRINEAAAPTMAQLRSALENKLRAQ
jgi:hypothetical protein